VKAWLALLWAMTLATAAAQGGSVSGVIRDEQGSPLQGAQVTLASSENSPSPSVATSDAHGAYRFSPVSPGTYYVQATLSGFAAGHSGSISVSSASADRTVDLTLNKSSEVRPQF
jgi:protocatechuate 3,4-dioxygenase beta subunit